MSATYFKSIIAALNCVKNTPDAALHAVEQLSRLQGTYLASGRGSDATLASAQRHIEVIIKWATKARDDIQAAKSAQPVQPRAKPISQYEGGRRKRLVATPLPLTQEPPRVA
ncbi:MAG: hypothetical protein P8P99_11255 [Maricaulis sp.]|jgi:hypothetical protein|nr:hypothetical protein [Maricaulis sp.]